MGHLHCADRGEVEEGPNAVVKRPLASTVVVAVLVFAACGDDDDSAPTTILPPGTTESTTTSTSTTTTTTTTTTTLPPTTSVDVEAIKAQVAADYVKTAQAVEDLLRNPTLDNLDARLAEIAVPGSFVSNGIRSTIQNYVANGQHAAPGTPDYSDWTVESVDLIGGLADGRADVTACLVTNSVLVDSTGQTVGGVRTLTAAKIRQPMQVTSEGWRQSDQATALSQQEDTATCAP
jgi:hypothetical protein